MPSVLKEMFHSQDMSKTFVCVVDVCGTVCQRGPRGTLMGSIHQENLRRRYLELLSLFNCCVVNKGHTM